MIAVLRDRSKWLRRALDAATDRARSRRDGAFCLEMAAQGLGRCDRACEGDRRGPPALEMAAQGLGRCDPTRATGTTGCHRSRNGCAGPWTLRPLDRAPWSPFGPLLEMAAQGLGRCDLNSSESRNASLGTSKWLRRACDDKLRELAAAALGDAWEGLSHAQVVEMARQQKGRLEALERTIVDGSALKCDCAGLVTGESSFCHKHSCGVSAADSVPTPRNDLACTVADDQTADQSMLTDPS
jgi:hypothetical protein